MIYFNNAHQVIQESIKRLKSINQDEMFAHRNMLINYYQHQNTKQYISDYFGGTLQREIPLYTTSLTKKIINRISMVYKDAPIRKYNNEVSEDINDLFYRKDYQMKSIERIHNLVGTMLIQEVWNEQKMMVEYRPIIEYEVALNPNDPKEVMAIIYPMIKTVDSKTQSQEDMFVYWSNDQHYLINADGYKVSINEGDVNPYGVMPFVTIQPNNIVDEYFNTGEGEDIAIANQQIDISMTMLQHHIRCAGGQMWVQGRADADKIALGLNKIPVLEDGILGVLPNQSSIESIMTAIEHQIKHVLSNHHIAFDFGISTQKSGVAIKLENLELLEAREDDVEKYRQVEKDLYNIEKILVATHLGKNLPDDFSIDYAEIDFPDPQQEMQQWDWWIKHGIKDKVDYIMEKDPDKFESREDVMKYLEERQDVRNQRSNIFSLRRPEENVDTI